MVLDGHFRCEIDLDRIRSISADATDVLILPGGFDLRQVLRALKKSTARVHIDSNVEPADSRTFRALGRNIDTVMMSTSSIPFLVRFRGSPTRLCNSLKKHVENILLKENRGGSRLFSKFRRGNAVGAPSHPKRIKHSIGVGDCFDAVFIALKSGCDDAAALAYASLVAAEYACELDPIRFRKAVRSILSIPQNEAVSFRGIRIAWERRPGCNVYIAAPDFEGVDTTHIDAVVQSLEYHNFSPRRPVREHGEVAEGAKLPVKVRAAKADMGLLTSCQILLAVLLFNDPGTLIEIGIALEKRIPVIVYDPHRIASNLILIALPDLVSSDLDEVITRVFSLASAKVA
jgi:nucleoside 2-deoxyribosyltransferase